MEGLRVGSPLRIDDFVGPYNYMESLPGCPSGGTYSLMKTIPNLGEVVLKCSHPEHQPKGREHW